MTKGECIYGHVNSTIVSICNGDYGNRTLTQDDARRGIMQLQKDCGADGSFSGIHVVNNLTFGAYGVYGGKGLAVPAGWDDPTTSGTRRRHLNAHEFLSLRQVDTHDPCVTPGFDACRGIIAESHKATCSTPMAAAAL